MGKVFRIDTPNGEYYTLTEEEMHNMFTEEELQEFQNDDQVIFYKTRFSESQLKHARSLHEDEDYYNAFVDTYGIYPEVYDIMKEIY